MPINQLQFGALLRSAQFTDIGINQRVKVQNVEGRLFVDKPTDATDTFQVRFMPEDLVSDRPDNILVLRRDGSMVRRDKQVTDGVDFLDDAKKLLAALISSMPTPKGSTGHQTIHDGTRDTKTISPPQPRKPK